jgi:hypothetical protein
VFIVPPAESFGQFHVLPGTDIALLAVHTAVVSVIDDPPQLLFGSVIEVVY